jgi:putative nucleotidyltransferase with HDIG domain
VVPVSLVITPSQPKAVSEALATAQRCVALSRGVVFVTSLFVMWSERLQQWADYPGLAVLTVVAFAYVLITSGISLSGREDVRLQLPLLVVDLMLVTGVIYSAGGIRNEYYLLYYIPIVQASVRLNFRDAITTALLAAGLYQLVGITTGPSILVQITAQMRTLAFCVSSIFMAAFFGLVGHELRSQVKRSEAMTRLTQSLSTGWSQARSDSAGGSGDEPVPDRIGATGPLADSLSLVEDTPRNVLRVMGMALGAQYGCLRLEADDGSGEDVTWVDPGAPSAAGSSAALLLPGKLVDALSSPAAIVTVPDVRAEPQLAQETDLPSGGDHSALVAPLAVGPTKLGTIALYRKAPTVLSPSRHFDAQDIRMACALSAQAALLLDYARLHGNLYSVLRRAVGTLTAAVDAKDPFTRGHSERVAYYSAFLARTMGLPPNTVEAATLGALLHDVGKIGMDEVVLKGNATLDEHEWRMIREHPVVGAAIFRQMPELSFLLPALRHHHERWDGRGYPDGLAGENIPLLARIMAIADAFDAMTYGRPYRKAPMTFYETCQEILNGAGTQFDPELARTFGYNASPELVREACAAAVAAPSPLLALAEPPALPQDQPLSGPQAVITPSPDDPPLLAARAGG